MINVAVPPCARTRPPPCCLGGRVKSPLGERAMKQTNRIQTLLIVTAIALAIAPAFAGGKLSSDLQSQLGSSASHRVIVTYAPGFGERDLDAIAKRGGTIHRNMTSVSAFAATLSEKEIADQAADPRVVSISPDRRILSSMDIALPATGANRISDYFGYTGRGVTVALVDSGISPSEAVSASRILASVDFTGQSLVGGLDGFGHGTHIASSIGGAGTNGAVRGMAQNVNFVSLKVLDSTGAGYASDAIEAINWAVVNKDRYGIRVLNLSLGAPPAESFKTDPVNRAVERAWMAGITIVASAGNRGRDGHLTINSPGNDPYVI